MLQYKEKKSVCRPLSVFFISKLLLVAVWLNEILNKQWNGSRDLTTCYVSCRVLSADVLGKKCQLDLKWCEARRFKNNNTKGLLLLSSLCVKLAETETTPASGYHRPISHQ